MKAFHDRQVAVLTQLISDYRAGRRSLNSLIHGIEGLGDMPGISKWKDDMFPLILSLEQVNAVTIESKRKLTASNEIIVEDALRTLEVLIKRMETD